MEVFYVSQFCLNVTQITLSSSPESDQEVRCQPFISLRLYSLLRPEIGQLPMPTTHSGMFYTNCHNSPAQSLRDIKKKRNGGAISFQNPKMFINYSIWPSIFLPKNLSDFASWETIKSVKFFCYRLF